MSSNTDMSAISNAVAEADRRGYLRGLEQAAKVADEHRAAFPECNDFTRGGDLVASKIAAAIRAKITAG